MTDLPSLLKTQDTYLCQMQEILEEEFNLLEQRQALALPSITERKQQLLSIIESLDKTLAGMPNLAAQLAAYPEQIAQIREKLACCQEQNAVNGRLLELSIVSNRRLANFLNQLRDRNSLTYDAKGNTRSGTRSHGTIT